MIRSKRSDSRCEQSHVGAADGGVARVRCLEQELERVARTEGEQAQGGVLADVVLDQRQRTGSLLGPQFSQHAQGKIDARDLGRGVFVCEVSVVIVRGQFQL